MHPHTCTLPVVALGCGGTARIARFTHTHLGPGTPAGHRPGQEGDISQKAKSQPIFKLPPQIAQSEMAGPTSKVASDLKLIELPTSTIHCMGPTPLPCAEFASQRRGATKVATTEMEAEDGMLGDEQDSDADEQAPRHGKRTAARGRVAAWVPSAMDD